MKLHFTSLAICMLLTIFANGQNPPCANSVILNSQQTLDADYESSNWIQSDQHIDLPAVVNYSAVDSICLASEFEVGLGAIFHAYIDPAACLGNDNPPCTVDDGALFSDVIGPFAFDAELCFDGMEVTVNITYPNIPYPTGMIIFIPPPGGGIPPGYSMTEISPGHFSRSFSGYTEGQAFDIAYLLIQDSNNSPPQYQTGAYSEILVLGCSDGSVNGLSVDVGTDETIIIGNSIALNSTVSNSYGSLTYEWMPNIGLSDNTIPNPIASPTNTTTYTLTVYDGNTCVTSDDITITVIPPPACLMQAGSGTYSTTLPAGEIGPSDNTGAPINTLFTSNLQAPYPTTDWWSSLAFPFYPDQLHSNNMFPRPLCVRAKSDGLVVGYPSENSGNNTYFYGFTEDLTLGTVGLDAAETKVADYSDWTVTADWSAGTLQTTFGHGLPYVFCQKNTTNDALIAFNSNVNIDHNENNYLGITVNGKHYGIFAPQGASWTQNGNNFTSDLNLKTYFSIAVLPDNTLSTLQEFADHAFAFVSDTKVSWVYDEATASLVSTFNCTINPQEGMNTNTLLALFPHQWKNSSDPLTSHSYHSGKGLLKVCKASSFQTTMTNKGILPHLPALSGSDASFLYDEIDAMYNNFTLGTGGTYWHSKDVQKLAQIIPLAEQVGHMDAHNAWLDMIKADLNSWFSYLCDDQIPLFYYDSTVGTLIGFPADFSMNSRLDDHHFHYGYFVMAAAIVAAYDSQWATDWGPMVELLIKDVANDDRTDLQFPFLRCMDPYAGHSWAGGWADFGDGNNQESTSEAINFAAAVLKWGAETCQPDLEELGMFLYLHETTAAREYWFDVDNSNFPASFPREYIALHWGAKADYATWFSGEPEHIHGINYLPITGYSLHLGYDPTYAASNFAEMETSNGGPVDLWIDVLWNYLALSDAATPLAAFNANFPYTNGENGESPAHTFHWLSNLNILGTVDATIQSNMTHSAVFNKNGTKTYVAYNPACETTRIVSFTDGTNFTVGSGELIVYP